MKNYLQRKNDREQRNELDLFGGAFDDLFGGFDFFGGNPFEHFRKEMKEVGKMRTDIKETEKGYDLSVDLPGFEKKDIDLTLKDGYLTITAKREEKSEDEKYLRRERYSTLSRSYYVGENLTEEDIKAKYENGILSLFVPKEEKKEITTKKIRID